MTKTKGNSRKKATTYTPTIPSLADGKVTVEVTLNNKVETRKVVAYGTHKDGSQNPNVLVPELFEGESLARFSSGSIIIFPKKVA